MATLRAECWRAAGVVAPQSQSPDGYAPFVAPSQRPASTQRTHSLFMRWVLTESQGTGHGLHRHDNVVDVLVERQADQFRSSLEVVALDRRGERFLFHLLLHAAGGHSGEFFR